MVVAVCLTACSNTTSTPKNIPQANKQGTLARLWTLISHTDASDLSQVNNPSQAQQWLSTQVNNSTQTQNNSDALNNQLQSTDRRLVRTVRDVPAQVFISLTQSIAKNSSDNTFNTPVLESDSEPLTATESSHPFTQFAPPTEKKQETIPLPVASDITLPLANLNQIRYVGMIQRNEQSIGLVRVGERVYRIQLKERIGQGNWPVMAINPEQMSLMVNGKMVNYTK